MIEAQIKRPSWGKSHHRHALTALFCVSSVFLWRLRSVVFSLSLSISSSMYTAHELTIAIMRSRSEREGERVRETNNQRFYLAQIIQLGGVVSELHVYNGEEKKRFVKKLCPPKRAVFFSKESERCEAGDEIAFAPQRLCDYKGMFITTTTTTNNRTRASFINIILWLFRSTSHERVFLLAL